MAKEKEPKKGDLQVWSRSNKEPRNKRVGSVKEAIEWIQRWSKKELHDNSIEYNAFGLEVFEEVSMSSDELGWCEYYDKHGRDVMEIIDEDYEN